MTTPEPTPLREALKEAIVTVFADGRGSHGTSGFCSLTEEGHQAIEQARTALAATPAGWECGNYDGERLGYACGRPKSHKGMHRRRTPLATPPAALDVERFLAGLDSPNHSPESRRAWIALFYSDMHRAAAIAAYQKEGEKPSHEEIPAYIEYKWRSEQLCRRAPAPAAPRRAHTTFPDEADAVPLIEAEAAAGLREACDIIEHLIDHFVPEYAPTDSGGDVDAALTARAFLAAAYQQKGEKP